MAAIDASVGQREPTSGAMYMGVPVRLLVPWRYACAVCLASPKSATLRVRLLVLPLLFVEANRMLCVLRSR